MPRPTSPTDGSSRRALSVLALVLLLLLAALAMPGPHVRTAQATNGVSKGMVFFLHWVNDTETSKTIHGHSVRNYFDTTLEFNDENMSVTSATTFDVEWWLVPALAGDFEVSELTLSMWMNATGSPPTSQVTVGIYDVEDASNNSDGALVAENNFGSVELESIPTLEVFSFVFEDGPYTFAAGHSMRVEISLTPGTDVSVTLLWDTPTVNSRVELVGPDSLDVAGIATLNATRDPTTNLDPNADNTTMFVQAEMTDPLGGYDIHWVNATILDPDGNVEVDNATMTKVEGTPLTFENVYEISWNYSDQPSGVYTAAIWAVDNNGHNLFFFFEQFTFGDFDVYEESTFSIGEFFFVNIQVLDNASRPLESAGVEARQLDQVLASATTNDTGMVNLTLGSGTYDFVAIWEDVDAGAVQATIDDNVTEDDPLVLNATVYDPTFRVLDSHDVPLADAALTYVHPNGTAVSTPLLTDDNGEASLSLAAGGVYNVTVRWRGIEVAQTEVDVNGSLTFEIPAAVFYVDFHVVDSQGVAIEFASVVVTDTASGLVLDFQTTDEDGDATSRLPVGTADVEVYVNDVLVAEVTGLVVDGDASMTLSTAVYYVTFSVVDSRSVPLDAATVRMEHVDGLFTLSVTTDDAGVAVARVPTGTYSVEVSWRGVPVLAPVQQDVAADVSVDLSTSVFYVTFETRDRQNATAEDALVVVRNAKGEVANSGTTDADGRVELRLPAASYTVSVGWKGHPVGTFADLAVTGDGTAVLAVDIRYYEVTVVDARDSPVRDTSLLVVDDAGTVLDTGATDSSGVTTLRLPPGTFTLTGTWRGVPVLETAWSVGNATTHRVQAQVFYLTVTVVDRDGQPLQGSIVAVEPATPGVGTLLAFTDADGTATFRLPPGQYTVRARLITTYQLTPVDVSTEDDVTLATADADMTLQLEEFRPPIHTTNAFLVTLVSVLAVVALVLFILFRYHGAADWIRRLGKGGEEEP